MSESPISDLRFRLGRWLLRPHWEPLLDHYERMQLAKNNPNGLRECENCSYIAIGICYALNLYNRSWGPHSGR